MRKRIARLAFLIVLAANEALERAGVLVGDKASLATRRRANRTRTHIDIGLLIRRAIRVDAHHARLLPESRHLHLGHAAGRTQRLLAFNASRRKRIGDIAFRPAGAADEHRTGLLARAQLEILAALRAFAHIGISRDRRRKRLAHLFGMGHELGQLLGEQGAAHVHDLFLGLVARSDGVHLLFEVGRHVGTRDMGRK